MTGNSTDVLIVGGGPAGLTLGIDLLRRGVSVRLVDASDSGFVGSRAKGLQPRTLEVFDDLGLVDDVLAHATTYPMLGLHVGPVTVPLAMARPRRPTPDVPYPNTMMVAQRDTDSCLRRRFHGLGGTVEFGTRLTGLVDAADGAVATLDTSSGRETVAARFVIGADGGRSTVRSLSGIEFEGRTDEADRMIVADVTVSGLSRTRWHVWLRRGRPDLGLCPLPDGRSFQLAVRLAGDDAAGLDDRAIRSRIDAAARRAGVHVDTVGWSSVFRANVRLAGAYRSGCVFLVGDAAHVHPPAGAQGLNTGVQDSYNLGWKLGQVLAGAPADLLDTYEAERRPVAARVLGLSEHLYAGMSARASLRSVRRGAEERQLVLTYRDGPLAAASPTTAGGRVQPGDRAPDGVVTLAAGGRRRFHELLRGPAFTLFAVDAAAAVEAAVSAWSTAGAGLHVVSVPSAGAAPGLAAAFGIASGGIVLIRPDGYVASIRPKGPTLDVALPVAVVPTEVS